MYDVLVVGGGPAGLYAADQLARLGRSVAVFEEHPTIGLPVHCTGLLAVDAFTRFSLPTGAVLGEHTAVRFRSPSGHVLRYSVPCAETVIMDRHVFDQQLAEQAVQSGAQLFLDSRVTQVEWDPHGITIQTKHKGPGKGTIRGRLLIVATGTAYYLQRHLGLGVPRQFVQTAQVEADFAGTSSDVELYFGTTLAPGSFAWVVPIQRDGQVRARIGLLADRDADGYLQRFLQSDVVATRITSNRLSHFRRRPIPLAPLHRTVASRVLVVGDAAGLAKPTTGGGIYYSLLSAELAASVACEALALGEYSAEFLGRYQRAWQELLGKEMWWGRWFRKQAKHLTDAQIDEAFQLASSESLDRLIRERATFNWHGHLIQALVRNRQVRSFLMRVLLNRGLRPVRWRDEQAPLLTSTVDSTAA